jgi:hypothetical protein
MKKWLMSLLCSKKNVQLEKEIVSLKDELDKRQEVINKTNAYWKKKLYALESKMKKTKGPSHDV